MKAPFPALMLALCCAAAMAQPGKGKAVQKPVPASAASAASSALPELPVRSSPAVRANEASQIPGDLRPEKRVVPQVAIPLRGDRDAAAATAASAASSAPGQVDDGAARRAATRPKK